VDIREAVLYRMAYGLAAALSEGADPNHPGRWRGSPAAGGEFREILAEVARRLDVREPEDLETVREAVADTLEGRRPRW
jgi:hypothetical protein